MEKVNQFIEACEFSKSNFLIFSENVFSPLIYYSHFFALIPAIIIGLIIFLKNPKKLENKLLFFMLLLFSAWIFSNLVTWATEFPKYTIFFWTVLVVVEPFIYFFAFYLAYVFFFKKDLSLRQKVIFSSPLIISLMFGPTDFSILGYDFTECYRVAIEGILASYGYAIEIFYVLFILYFSYKAFYHNEIKDRKKENLLFTFGMCLFLLSFSIGNIVEVFLENWDYGHFGLFGAPIFVGFLAYLIVKFKTFNVKLIAPQALVFTLIFLNIAMLTIRKIENIRYVLIPTIIISSIAGYILVRSVKKIDHQKELLDIANKEQENLIHFISHQVKGFFTKSRNIFDTLSSETEAIDTSLRPLVLEGLRSDKEGIMTVTNILNASNLKSGKINFISGKLYLNILLEKIIEKELPLVEHKKLILNYEKSSEMIEFWGDEIRLQDAITNIIQNAINYTNSGSINIKLKREAKNIFLIISDTGIGLTESDKVKLFKSGGRGDESLKYNVNSTGYGLFISKQIIEKHGGSISAQSEGRGKGSTFTIKLPLSPIG